MNDVKVANNRPARIVLKKGDEVLEDEIQDEVIKLEDKKKVELHSYIPDSSYAKKYVNRKILGINDFDLMDYCMKRGKNLLLRGDTGAGKTMMPMAYAARFGIPYYSIPCDVAIDTSSLFGKMMPTDVVGKFEWTDGPVTELVRNGGILNISEVNFMPAKIAASLYQILDGRRSLTLLAHKGETIKAHKKLLIVADMNPKYRGTVELNTAFANRWPVKLDWDYDPNVESKLIPSTSLLGIVRNIRKLPDVRTPIGTNAMQEFIELEGALGYNFALANFIGSFEASERDGVKKAFDVQELNLKRELAAAKAGKTAEEDMEEVAEDAEWFKEEGDLNDFDWDDDEDEDDD